MRLSARVRPLLAIPALLCAVFAGAAVRRVQDTCGPFTDVSPMFCPYVLEAYYTGITAGTSPTTFSPDMPITRGQAAVFAAKGLNQALARGSRRAALGQWWTTHSDQALGFTAIDLASLAACDGADIWVRHGDKVARVHGSDGKLLEEWDVPSGGAGVLVAMGRIFAVGYPPTGNGHLYMIDPAAPPGAATDVAQANAGLLAFDGARIWATIGPEFAVNIITPGPTLPWTTTAIAMPDNLEPNGILFDGSNVWVTAMSGVLMKLDQSGAILQSVPLGDQTSAGAPVFDGANIWIPSASQNAVVVVRAADGAILATLTGNGLNLPVAAAFDGQRVLVTGLTAVSVWNAADLSPLGFTPMGQSLWPCSDGINFWIPTQSQSGLVRF